MFSILIPTFNNLEYLKICLDSLKKNSKFNHQIIIHINQGTDGTLEYIKENNLEYTYSNNNIGMPRALNLSSKKAKFNYILISHDDFYYCPSWDLVFEEEILSDWTMVSNIKLFSAKAKHIEAATPGLSGSLRKLT